MTDPKLLAQLEELNRQRKLQGLPQLSPQQGALALKYLAEYEQIERQRKAEGLPPLTPEQATRRGIVDAQRDLANHQIQIARKMSSRLLPIRIGLLLLLLAIILAVFGRILLH